MRGAANVSAQILESQRRLAASWSVAKVVGEGWKDWGEHWGRRSATHQRRWEACGWGTGQSDTRCHLNDVEGCMWEENSRVDMLIWKPPKLGWRLDSTPETLGRRWSARVKQDNPVPENVIPSKLLTRSSVDRAFDDPRIRKLHLLALISSYSIIK